MYRVREGERKRESEIQSGREIEGDKWVRGKEKEGDVKWSGGERERRIERLGVVVRY